ncbi:hypothetical protein OF820_04170 [Oceanotoga sp. DSM 15011]|jgi:hypothetical protein|uniref:Uncharacterized protein n=1 Tax=Oceanotoga teriensis TaxID=515440 RepID=A0AA45C896_9BACT|nr:MULTISPECIES: hypothetical protein [Oceanotoga]MDN5341131.1 hypothetical protein [Oceanotoga sp.]MDO7976813.1 hypothetical protein [Oceanotoga teriensis]PWJ95889.1 hypothetical protein C7380_10367 [Oceanotoga teriensis]UYP00885.1 hypothetical protein OF820_04170 [Oceanotoga sp. DSM 15011]
MISEKIINEIITACRNDTRLISIVKDVANMDKNTRYEFRKKASIVLKGKHSIEKEALKFYYLVTEDGISEEVIRRLEDE